MFTLNTLIDLCIIKTAIKTKKAFLYKLFTMFYQRRNIGKSKRVWIGASGKKGVNLSEKGVVTITISCKLLL